MTIRISRSGTAASLKLWTGLWVAPLFALGLTLLAISFRRRSRGLRVAGTVLLLAPLTVGLSLAFLVIGWWQAAGAVVGTALAIIGVWFLMLAWAPRPNGSATAQA